ncbi:hypothetical protein BSM4216_3743 [Bacillus smithii]|nr:hypothetical protein BSM4216_3743 [Bacillus smithii]
MRYFQRAKKDSVIFAIKKFSKLLYTQQKAHHQKNKDFKKFFKENFSNIRLRKNTKVKERPDVETGRRLFMDINSYPKRV